MRKNNQNKEDKDKEKRKPSSYKKKPYKKPDFKKKSSNPTKSNDGTVRLNKFLANAGICSRREADTLIQSGVVEVNGKVVTTLGTKIKGTDKVSYGGETIKNEKKVYVLMNKPKDFITTVNDPLKRRTVLQLLGKLKQRIQPVGKLDRATTGVLMFTNDNDLAKRLTHPKLGVKKIYHATLHKNVTSTDMQKLLDGFELEDGFAKVDAAVHVGNGKDKKQVGIEVYSGKNRIVRRMFEHLDYKVIKLDRVYFAGLTKKKPGKGTMEIPY